MKKLMNRIKPVMLMIASGIMLVTCLNSCKQDHLTINTTGVVNIYSYLQQDSQFSMFKQIVDKAGYASFLNTYGTYTLFLPNNDGVSAYLKATNQASVDNIDAATAKQLVGITLIADTIGTQFFTDGKLRSPSTLGQYLITGAINVNGVTTTIINKQANLVQGNIRVGNGLIHVIDNMLVPAPSTLAKTIEDAKDSQGQPKYGIFLAALKATGFYDTLNHAVADNPDANRKYLTVIAESDSVIKAAGYPDYNAFASKYSTKQNPQDHADSLWLFMAYHIWSELSYVSDISIIDSHQTLAPLELTTSVKDDQKNVLLNDETFNGVHEIGSKISRAESDISATNGVLHSVLTNYTIKIRVPSPVYFDVAAQPEIIKTPGLYRVLGRGTMPFKQGTLANVTLTYQGGAGDHVIYSNDSNPTKYYYYYNDWLQIGDRFRTGSNGCHSVEFVTPVIVRGQYKLWVDYLRQGSHAQVVPAYFDDVALPNTFHTGDPLNPNEVDAAAEARGYKSYSDAPVGTSTSNGYAGHVGRLLGIVDIKTTDHHRVRFEATTGSGDAAYLMLDVLEFRPVDMDQIRPRLGHDGNLVP